MTEFGFQYKGKHSYNDKGIWVFDVGRPILAGIEARTMNIDGADGLLFLDSNLKEQNIPVDVGYKGTDPANVMNVTRDLAYWLRSEDVQPLIFDDEPDKFYSAVLTQNTDLKNVVKFREGTLNFLVPDPYAYALEDDVFTYAAAGSYDFNRQGTASSYPKIEIEGTIGDSDAITVELNNNALTFTGTLQSGEKLVLDSEYLTAYIMQTDGSKVSAMNDLNNLNFPITLAQVVNNLTVSTSGSVSLDQIKLTCRSRWF